MSTQRCHILAHSVLYEAFELGALAQSLGQDRKAFALYRKEIARTGYYKAYYNLGTLLEQRGRYGEAIQAFKRAIKGCPGLHLAHNYLGLIYTQVDRPKEAARAFSRAIQLNKLDPVPVNNLGLTYWSSGRAREAEKAFRRALSLAPSNPEALTNLGDLLVSECISISEGIALLRKARRIRPRDPEILIRLASACLRRGALTEARRLVRELEKLHPETRWVVRRLRKLKNAISN